MKKSDCEYIVYGKPSIYSTAKIVQIGDYSKFVINDKTIIGDYAFIALNEFYMHHGAQIAPHACLSGGGKIVMFSNSVVGFGAQLITGTDTPKGKFMCEAASDKERKVIRGSITLKPGAYVGSGAIICVSSKKQDIIIGHNSVVGAGTYLDESVPDNTIVHPVQNLLWSARTAVDLTCPVCGQKMTFIPGSITVCIYCKRLIPYADAIKKNK